MSVPQRDDNGYPTWAGLSCVDGVTPVEIVWQVIAGKNYMKIDTTTSISVVPSHHNSGGEVPIVRGVSSTNSKLVLPFYVNPSNGAVLTDLI